MPTGSGPAKRRNRTATEDRILDAGKTVFARRGYDAASVREIAEEAQANVSLINRYFGSKEGLLVAITESFLDRKRHGALSYPPQPTLAGEIYHYLHHRLKEDRAEEEMVRLIVSRVAIDAAFHARAAENMDGEADQNFRDRLSALREAGAIGDHPDINMLFAMVSYFSFASNFFGALTQSRSAKDIDELFATFANSLATGILK